MTAALVGALAGCVDIEPAPPLPDDPFAFGEDADPAVAALEFAQTELLFQPYPGADAKALSDLYTQVGVTVVDELIEIELAVLNVPDGDLVRVGAELSASCLLETVQKIYFFDAESLPDDPLFSG